MFFRRTPKKVVKEDEELLSLYKDSADIAFLGELYDRYIHLVFGICMKYLKNQEESEDMTMQIFEKLIVAAEVHEIKNFKSWLHVLARNECLMLLRSGKYKHKQTNVPLKDNDVMELAYSLHPDSEESLESNLTELEEAIEMLPSEQRDCVKKFYLNQKCYKTIALETGYEINKVKSYIQNGKRNLKRYMHRIDE